MKIRATKLKVGDETLQGFVIASIEQAEPNPKMLKVTYTKRIPYTKRNWEFVHMDEYCYLKESEEVR